MRNHMRTKPHNINSSFLWVVNFFSSSYSALSTFISYNEQLTLLKWKRKNTKNKLKGQITSYHEKPHTLLWWGYSPSRWQEFHRHLDSAFNNILNRITMTILWTRQKHVGWMIVNLGEFVLNDIRVRWTHSWKYYHTQIMCINELVSVYKEGELQRWSGNFYGESYSMLVTMAWRQISQIYYSIYRWAKEDVYRLSRLTK